MAEQKPAQNWPRVLRHPSLVLIYGRRGSGKSHLLGQICRMWPKEHGRVVLVDERAVVNREERYADVLMASPPGDTVLLKRPLFDDRPVTLVAVDEAAHYLPRQGKPDPMLSRLVSEGRHWNMTLILATQRPAMMSYNAWSLADMAFIFNLNSKADLKRVVELDGAFESRTREIQRLPVGECFLWDSKNFEHPVRRIRIAP